MTEGKGTRSEGYERRDLYIRGIVVFLVVLAVIVVAVLAGMNRMFEAFRAQSGSLGSKIPVGVAPDSHPRPGDLTTDLSELRRSVQQEEERQLHAFGWVDRKGGIARIPIETAIEIVAEDGAFATESPAEERD